MRILMLLGLDFGSTVAACTCRHMFSTVLHTLCRFFDPPDSSSGEVREGIPVLKTSESRCHVRLTVVCSQCLLPLPPLVVFVQGWLQRWTALRESFTNMYSVAMIRRKLRSVDPFRPVEFARRAQEMFVATNAALQQRDKKSLRMLTTENALKVGRQHLVVGAVRWG